MDLDEEDTALLIIHPTPLRQAFNRTAPQDSYERERLDYVHPSGWPNPQPADPSSRSSSFAIGLEIKSEFLVGTGYGAELSSQSPGPTAIAGKAATTPR